MSWLVAFLIRLMRRIGRFAIAMVATAAFFVGGGLALLLMVTLIHRVSVLLCLGAAFSSSVGVFLLFDRLNLLPDDVSEAPTQLGLSGKPQEK